MPDDAIERARRSGFNAGIDHIANFINALDSEGMTGRDVRSAIYSECLEARPGLLAFASQQAPEGWRERVRHLDLALSDGIDAAASAPAGHRIQMLAATIRDARLTIRAMLDAAPSVTLGEVG